MNQPPFFLCLAPLWNHRQETIENSIQCFLDQTYSHKRLLLIDDRPGDARPDRFWNSTSLMPPQVEYTHSNWRFASLPSKYNWAMNRASFASMWLERGPVSHIAIWDDDDGFSPRHLELAAEAYLKDDNYPFCTPWTYPSTVFTTFGGHLHTEPSGGRFWSSITFQKDCLWDDHQEAWLFPDRKACGHDQMFLDKLQKKFGDPLRPEIPTYVYRWGREAENHSSGVSTGLMCERWWEATPYATATRWFEPQYDEFYKETMKEMEAGFPASIRS